MRVIKESGVVLNLQGKKKFFQSGVRWLILSGVLAAVTAGGWIVYAKGVNRAGKPVAVSLLTVKQDDVEVTINESGTVELGGQQSLKSPGEVTVDRVLVEVGDHVGAGQQLIRLRDVEQQTAQKEKLIEIQQQELNLARSHEKVKEVQEKLAIAQKELQQPDNHRLKIQQQELTLTRNHEKVKEAQEKLVVVQQEIEQTQTLADNGLIATNELRKAQEKLLSAQGELRDAELAVSNSRLEIRSLQQESNSSQATLKEKVMSAQAELREAQLAINISSRELQNLQLALRKTQQQLQNNVVTAPIGGKVLDVKVKNGDGVKSGDVLLTIGDPAQELIQLQISTLDAAKVQVGQKARVSVIGPDSQLYTGRVERLYPQAIAPNNSDASSRQSKQAKVPATVQLDKPSGTLIPGSQVSVQIILEQRQNVVALELSAIQRSDSDPFVWIRGSQGKAQKKTVTLGLEDETSVEVKSGLRPGDQIIIPPPETPLEPGTSVIPQSPSEEIPSAPEASVVAE